MRVSLLACLAMTMALASFVTWTPPSQAQTQGAASKQILNGQRLYATHCASCHGANGEGARDFPRPIWGSGHSLAKLQNGTGLFDFNDMQMPFDDPQKASSEAKVDITVFMLFKLGAIPATASLQAAELEKVAIK
jgi:mono/diheme cytochrome c family protein